MLNCKVSKKAIFVKQNIQIFLHFVCFAISRLNKLVHFLYTLLSSRSKILLLSIHESAGLTWNTFNPQLLLYLFTAFSPET